MFSSHRSFRNVGGLMTNIRSPIYSVRKPDSISRLARFKWQEGVSNIHQPICGVVRLVSNIRGHVFHLR